MEYNHFPISENGLLQFSYFCGNYEKGHWNKYSRVSVGNYKLNVFIKGEFTVLVGDNIYEPKCGDVFLVEPMEIHCGNITKDTYIEYYQFDFSKSIFDFIPDGEKMFENLICSKNKIGPFLRTKPEDSENISRLCEKIGIDLDKRTKALAFANFIELTDLLIHAFEGGSKIKSAVFSAKLSEAIRIIEKEEGKISVAELADALSVSESYILRIFKREMGETVSSYIMRQKLSRSAICLSEKKDVTAVAFEYGFSDASHYISRFKKNFGCTPGEYVKKSAR